MVKLFHGRTTDLGYARAFAELSRPAESLPSEMFVRTLEIGLLDRRLAVIREDVEGVSLGLALRRLTNKDVILQPAVALAIVIEMSRALRSRTRPG